ncbi:malate synthase [Shewanella sp. AS1]|uniref:malate synthase n=1 Tax=Shewanella sp. AS1 TaxID=2907626 RepID=UPI001F45EC20|nr:malate synthase [Shewanella sp. AS1]MCE9678209.1 malate synthase [Shewanella sp. AS1]
MNIQAKQTDVIEQGIYSFIKQVMPMTQSDGNCDGNSALAIETRNDHSHTYAKQVLDKYFPLSGGSHLDVTSYVIYYQQLLAFFRDGTQSGLVEPKQFVAFAGHKCEPCAVLLKNNGFHLELSLNCQQGSAREDLSGIKDVQVEAALMTIVSSEQAPFARRWTSLITGLEDKVEKQFTAKDGLVYEL